MSRRQYWLSRRQRRYISLVLAIIVAGFWFGQQHGWFGSLANKAQEDQPGLYSINHFIDGDTIAVNMNGQSQSIRFIGVDTPETHKPNTPVECYGPQAAAYTRQRITDGGGKVRLASDPDSTDRDRYGRLLRYIYLPDGTLLEQALISNGYGFYYPYFPFTKSTEFEADQQQAIASKQGMWSKCTPTPSDDGGYKMNEVEPASLDTS